MDNQKGQVIIILILVMTVALAIGLSVIQRSLSDISTSSKVEQSSRAFSAAEAGIEKALNCPTCASISVDFSETNQSSATVTKNSLMPAVPAVGTRQEALEYPPLAKEEVAHVWLADYTSTANPPPAFYTQTTLDVYWGNSTTDKAALELTLVYWGTDPIDPIVKYRTRKWYLDHSIRTPDNRFEVVTNCGTGGNRPQGGITAYQCKKIIDLPSTGRYILLRARLLYNTSSQPFAVQAVSCPGTALNCQDYSIPPQARTLISTGIAGSTQRQIKLFRIDKVVPPYFDYAIFSTGAIDK